MIGIAEIAGIGHNRSPEPIEPAPEDRRVTEVVKNATQWSGQHPIIETEDVAEAAADWIKQLSDIYDEFEQKFKKEKEPHDTALKTIRAKWNARLERLEICLKAIKPLHRAYIKLKDARLKSEREAAERDAAEAQRIADQLAEQAGSGGPSAVTNMIHAAEAAREAERARQVAAAVPRRAQVRSALGGRTHSLRTVWTASVIEQDLVYRHFRDHSEVKGLLQRLANAAARGGVRNPDLPGCWISSEEQ